MSKSNDPNKSPALVWFRRDLRLNDNPALNAAIATGAPVVPIFIWSPKEEGDWAWGGASLWWFHHSLKSLSADLERLTGSKLAVIQSKSAEAALERLREELNPSALYWNRRYEPHVIERDSKIKASFKSQGVDVQSFNGALLFEPHEVQNKSGNPFKVFTPFWKHCLTREFRVHHTKKLKPAVQFEGGVALDELKLTPNLPWANAFPDYWSPGERGAQENLDRFLKDAVNDYNEERNRPDHSGTSRLSPHLAFGEISPRQIVSGLLKAFKVETPSALPKDALVYLSEIGWREFAYHLLYHFPHTTTEPLRPEFAKFPWEESEEDLRAWQKGLTGYPIVDAGMRELWATGWMHNRVRMIVASFLIKDLRIHWIEGARWFWDTLVDADLASNTMGWQWTAGSGADAAPYFRIFNPVSQGERFDPEGDYVRKWVPELRKLPAKCIHQPWTASDWELKRWGVEIGKNYPERIVHHDTARKLALDAYKKLKDK